MTDKMTRLIEVEEGWRSRPYLCSESYPTVGFGFKLGDKATSTAAFDFTLPKSVGEEWLRVNLAEVGKGVNGICWGFVGPWYPRDAVLVSMAYQMGVGGLAKFKNMLAAYNAKDFDKAATEMLDSRWARQTPKRAERHAEQMRSGVWDKLYD